MARWVAASALVGAVLVATATGAGSQPGGRTKLTVWSQRAPDPAVFGGSAYGGAPAATSALVTEQREVAVSASGEVRFSGVAPTVDPGSVQIRDLTEPAALVAEQRFHPGAATPSLLLARGVGEPVTVVTAKGELAGVLRGIDPQVLALEVGTGDQRRISVLQRSAVIDVRLPASTVTTPTFAWRLGTKKPGTHSVEVTYRADGIAWTADYLAVLAEGGKQLDFSAWATVRNATGAKFTDAQLVLVDGGGAPARVNPYLRSARLAPAAPTRFTVARPITVGTDESVQVELVPAKVGLAAKHVIVFESMPDASTSFQDYPGADCSQFNGANITGTANLAVEVELGTKAALPAGRVRLFKRNGDQLEVVNDEPLQVAAGTARMTIAPVPDLSSERAVVACNVDESARTLDETIEVTVHNKGAKAADLVMREYPWRWTVWKVQRESTKSARVAPQALEYRVSVPAKGKASVTYAVRYTW